MNWVRGHAREMGQVAPGIFMRDVLLFLQLRAGTVRGRGKEEGSKRDVLWSN